MRKIVSLDMTFVFCFVDEQRRTGVLRTMLTWMDQYVETKSCEIDCFWEKLNFENFVEVVNHL